ncbi:unnamed protein product, partial [Iphiclides podalirius]
MEKFVRMKYGVSTTSNVSGTMTSPAGRHSPGNNVKRAITAQCRPGTSFDFAHYSASWALLQPAAVLHSLSSLCSSVPYTAELSYSRAEYAHSSPALVRGRFGGVFIEQLSRPPQMNRAVPRDSLLEH